MSEGFVREPAHHRVPWRPLTSAVLAPLVWFNDSALEHRSVGFQVLSDGLETELVEAAERGQAGRIKSRVGHVEVFRMGSVGTSIFRETSTPTRTATRSTDYTLVREEPDNFEGLLCLMARDSCRRCIVVLEAPGDRASLRGETTTKCPGLLTGGLTLALGALSA